MNLQRYLLGSNAGSHIHRSLLTFLRFSLAPEHGLMLRENLRIRANCSRKLNNSRELESQFARIRKNLIIRANCSHELFAQIK